MGQPYPKWEDDKLHSFYYVFLYFCALHYTVANVGSQLEPRKPGGLSEGDAYSSEGDANPGARTLLKSSPGRDLMLVLGR